MNLLLLRDQNGREYYLEKDLHKLGRALDNDIIIKDLSISRYHLAIQPMSDSQIAIHNTGSEGGFYVNNDWYQDSGQAHAGDIIRVGNLEFKLESLAQAPEMNNDFQVNPEMSKSINLNVDAKAKKIRMLLFLVIAGMGAAFFMQEEEQAIPKTQEATKATVGITNESFTEYTTPSKGPQELTAEDYYKQGMREFTNENYLRAIQLFQQSLTGDPTLKKSQDSLQEAENKLKIQTEKMVESSEKNYLSNRFSLAKSESIQALNLLSEQIPGYGYQIQNRLRDLASQRLPIPTRETFYLELKCDQTPQVNLCERSLDILVRSRKRLGEDNVLK